MLLATLGIKAQSKKACVEDAIENRFDEINLLLTTYLTL